VDFKWAGDAPAAAKIFVQDQSFDAFVGWSPDIYTVTGQGARHAAGRGPTGSANHSSPTFGRCATTSIATIRDIVANLVRGIFDGNGPVAEGCAGGGPGALQAFNIPVEDCQKHDRQGRPALPPAMRT